MFMPNWYGLIVGVAGVVGYQLFLVRAEREPAHIIAATIFSGLIGARAWHVMTDWQLYVSDPLAALMIWRGGLSIFGAIAGGALGLWLSTRSQPAKRPKLLDLAVFGLPAAQAIGRWGNYVNQELYGWPTTLPWGIPIDPQHRLPGLENNTHFHPLFLYESIMLVIFAALLWWKNPTVGSGRVFALYLAWYAWWRVGLDFLRATSPIPTSISISFNQFAMILVGTFAIGWLWYDRNSNSKTQN